MFTRVDAKGLHSLIYAEGASRNDLTIHISEIEPGTRAHPPHTHAGVECFLVFNGNGRVEVGEECVLLGTGDAIVLDASDLHGLENVGDGLLRYAVIIAPQVSNI